MRVYMFSPVLGAAHGDSQVALHLGCWTGRLGLLDGVRTCGACGMNLVKSHVDWLFCIVLALLTNEGLPHSSSTKSALMFGLAHCLRMLAPPAFFTGLPFMWAIAVTYVKCSTIRRLHSCAFWSSGLRGRLV